MGRNRADGHGAPGIERQYAQQGELYRSRQASSETAWKHTYGLSEMLHPSRGAGELPRGNVPIEINESEQSGKVGQIEDRTPVDPFSCWAAEEGTIQPNA